MARRAPAPATSRGLLRASGLPEAPALSSHPGSSPALQTGDTGAAVARAAAFGHSFERLPPAAPAPIQAVFKDPADPTNKRKSVSREDVKARIAAVGLPKKAKRRILALHAHKRRYDLESYIQAHASVFGATNPGALGTYGTLTPIRSSKLRHARRIYREFLRDKRFSRNVAVQKLQSTADASKKIYVGALSLGLGVSQLEQDDPSGQQRKRSHSEAVLAAAHLSGGVKDQDDNEVDLSGFKPEHASSTNEFCQSASGQQNCHGDLAPLLTADKTLPAHIGVKYAGSDDADQFKRTLLLHDLRKAEDPSYVSEAESEDDTQTPFYFIDDRALRGKKVRKGGGRLNAKKILRGQDRYHPYS